MEFGKWGGIVAAAAAIAGATPAGAETAGEAAQSAASVPASASPGAGPVWLDTISITATRNPIEAFEYPGMVTVVGREKIETLQPSTPDDILKWVPNVEFTGGPRRTGEVPSIRGFSGPDVIVTLDGARQNFASGHDGRFFVDPSLLREVEVLRGPASALYGSGGTGGIIALRTVRAADFLGEGDTVGATVSGGYQSVNREKFETFTAYGRPVEDLDLLGSFTKRNSGSIELGDGTELGQTDDDIIGALAKAGWRFADHHNVEASFQRFSNDAQEPNNGQGAGGDGLVEKDIRADNWRLGYSYENPDDDLIDLDVTGYYTEFQADELRLDDNGTGPRGELLKRDVGTLGFRVDNRSRLSISDDIGVTFTYGGEGYRDEQDGADAQGERDGVPDAEADFAGVFGQAEIRVTQPFRIVPGDFLIIPGLRFDHYTSSSSIAEENEDQALSPRIGVSYLPTEWSLLFANYAHAFRAPAIDELYLEGVHFRIPIGPGVVNRFVANPGLKPQSTRTIEFGGGFDFKDVLETHDRLQVKASHFRIDGEDFIDLEVNQPEPFVDCNPFIPGACDGTTRSFNVPEAELWGNEVEASYENSLVRLALGFATIDGENRQTGEKLGVLTPPQLTVDAAVKLAAIDSVIGWRMLAADEFDEVDDPSERRDAYAVHDFYFAWSPSDGPLAGLRVDLGIDNAFDKAYDRVFTGATEPGRNFKVLVSYSLKW